ncbi:MAG: AAA family ATPase [Candidatus Calescibacterium sp.]|nr:AAA family ATPase [Candidatus Calescibacterium sp.]MDW8133104.1 AAA family ATPase [Candidatus Calescibacterium sp.]
MDKKLPIGISSFEKIRTDNYFYVDKTHFVKKLLDQGSYFFLSRPRRFGKSLFLDTIKCAFEGKKDLFKGLYLENNWNWDTQYPTIRFSFDTTFKNPSDLEEFIQSLQNYWAEFYIENTQLASQIRETLKGLYQTIKPLDKYLKFVFIICQILQN